MNFHYSCSLCEVTENPLNFDNRITTSGEMCSCDVKAPNFTAQAIKRLSGFLQTASRANSVSFAIKNKEGRKNDKFLLHRQLGDAILSPHDWVGWGLVDFSWSCEKYSAVDAMQWIW